MVALKRVTPSGPQADAARARFFAEAQITGQLQHPGFLPILDCGLDPLGRPFFTTYLLTGRTFRDLIRELRGVRSASDLAFRRALEVFETICRIVAYAHSRLVFHRDLKPSNILLGSFGEVYVIDMGAAFVGSHDSIEGDGACLSEAIRTEVSDAAAGNGASPYRTSQSGRPWTPLYSPPELVRGELIPDERTCDVFALGAMLYELVAGHPPYAASDGSIPEKNELIERILAGPPARLASTADWVPRDLEAVCQRASNRDPTRRYTAVDEIADEVRAFLETRVVRARESGWVDHVGKWFARHSRRVVLAAIAVAMVSLFAAVAWSYKVGHDTELQLRHLRDARISARTGEWSQTLSNLDAAVRAGYSDTVDLGLQRYAAHIALADASSADRVLNELLSLPNLGNRRGAVLLRRAEHDLHSPATAERGLKEVREALAAGLDPADSLVATGLLSTTSSNALACFREALARDPFHHAAHRHSLGLEFALGQNDRLQSHFSILSVLYPHDPTPVYLQAFRAALDGRANEAETIATTLTNRSPPELLVSFVAGLRAMSDAAGYMELDSFLGGRTNAPSASNPFLAQAVAFGMGMAPLPSASGTTNMRIPQLPWVKEGLEKGARAVGRLALGPADDADSTIRGLQEALAVHPEGLVALIAATIRDARLSPVERTKPEFLRSQAQLLQMAAEIPSVLPTVPVIARILATAHQRDLAIRTGEPDEAARSACHANLEWFVRNGPEAATANRALARISREVGRPDFGRVFIVRWLQAEPASSEAWRSRIDLEEESGASLTALQLCDERLAQAPDDSLIRATRDRLRQPHRSPLPVTTIPETPP